MGKLAMDVENQISVVVAVYNVEDYLPRCIDSILQQTYSNLEILLVNDGSTDNSGAICHRYAQIDSRIVVIDKENGGLTSARKAGFEEAHGEYFVFIDSDDYLEKDYIETLFHCLTKNRSDIAICSYYLNDDQKQIPQKLLHSKAYFTKKEFAKELILPSIYPFGEDQTRIPNFMWLRLYSRKVISDGCFVSEREVYTEDLFFNAGAYLKCDKISIEDEPLYHYCLNATSLTHKYRKNKYAMEKNRVKGIERILNQYGITDKKRLYLTNIRLIWECIDNAVKLDSYLGYKNEVKMLFQDQELRKLPLSEVLGDASLGEKIFYYCFKYKLYLVAYYLKKFMKIRGMK